MHAGVRCEVRSGRELTAAQWRQLHHFYQTTFDEKGNLPALTLDFFEHLGQAFGDRVLAVLAWRKDRVVAGALLLRSADALFGRYWGCSEQLPGLHFEVCYYQGIEFSIRNGLQRYEPGAQGEHKLARGFLPTMTRSFHHLADTRFRVAVRQSLTQEARVLRTYHQDLMRHSPYALTA